MAWVSEQGKFMQLDDVHGFAPYSEGTPILEHHPTGTLTLQEPFTTARENFGGGGGAAEAAVGYATSA